MRTATVARPTKRKIKSRALIVVQRYFPQVRQLRDATQGVMIEVRPRDIRGADPKSMQNCALARACKRAQHVEGALASPSAVYLVEGDTATRYKVPQSTSQEIKIFDRAGGFAPGEYRLSPVPPRNRFGVAHAKGSRGAETGEQVEARRHYTTGIRRFS